VSAGAGDSHRTIRFSLWACLFLVVAFRFAEPFLDGDLFWHMAYARQMLARGTLIPDHTAFSWTPATDTMIYCAWAAELWLYWLWTWLGPWSLFALRYIVVLGVVALAARYARVAGMGRAVIVPAVLVLFVLMSNVGTIIKPELFSFFFLNVVVWIYFRAKVARANGRDPAAAFYVVPAIVAVWVNHHGGFILAAPFLAATAAGEWLNARASRALAFSKASLKHLVCAWALCGVAVTLTPYGVRYPIQLVQDYVLGRTPRPDVAWNAAHQAVFSRATLSLHLAEFLAILGGALLVLLVSLARKARDTERVDWSVVLLNAIYLALYLPQLRTTYAWPVIGTYSVFYLLFLLSRLAGSDRERLEMRSLWTQGAFASLGIGLAIFLSARAVYEARYRPLDKSWLGFGISDVNPVAEAEFLAAARVGPRLYNIFDSGGYLLWRLDPAYKVMTDSRSFPYLSWFDEQRRFTDGEIFDEFLRKYPADVAVIDLTKELTVRHFLNAPNWRLVYFGPTAAIFATSAVTIPAAAIAVAPDRFRELRNPATAERVFHFATLAGDFRVAWQALDQLEARHRRSVETDVLRSAEAYRDAHRAIRSGDFVRARQLFAAGLRGPVVSRRDARILELLRTVDQTQRSPATAAAIALELKELAAEDPKDPRSPLRTSK
jgi:hypothetical protein